jgi:hypothetical protein
LPSAKSCALTVIESITGKINDQSRSIPTGSANKLRRHLCGSCGSVFSHDLGRKSGGHAFLCVWICNDLRLMLVQIQRRIELRILRGALK